MPRISEKNYLATSALGESEMGEQIFTLIMYVLQYIPVLWGFNKLFETRWDKKKSLIVLTTVAIAIIVIKHCISMKWLTVTATEYMIMDTIVFTGQIGLLYITFKGNWLKKTFAIMIIMMMAPTIASIIALSAVPKSDTPYNEVYPGGAALVVVFMWIITPIAVYFIKNIADRTLPSITWMYLIFPFSQYITLTIISDLLVLVSDDDKSTYFYSLIASFSFLVADIIFIIMILKTTENERARQKLETEKYINKSENMYYQHINDKIAENMKIRHDMKNILSTAEKLISSDEGESSNQLIAMLKKNVEEAETSYFCENKILNAILYDKSELAERDNIKFKAEVTVPDDIDIDYYDICRAFSNVLDNAIEGASASENKEVSIKAKIDMGYLMIVSVNSCKNVKDLKTTKRYKDNHGFGIKIIKDIAAKYNGDTEFISKNNEFTCRVWMKAV